MPCYRGVKLRLTNASYPGLLEGEGRNLADKSRGTKPHSLFDKSKMKPAWVSPPAAYNIWYYHMVEPISEQELTFEATNVPAPRATFDSTNFGFPRGDFLIFPFYFILQD